MADKNISAVTVTYFSDLSLIRPLLVSTEAAAGKLYAKHGYGVEYYIIDNSADEDYFWRLEMLCYDFFDNDHLSLHIVRAPKNLGFGGGNNLVLNRLDSEFHLVINPDVTLEPLALCRAMEYLEKNADVGMVSPKIVDASSISPHVIKRYPDCLTLFLRYAEIPMLSKFFSSRLERYACSDFVDESSKDVQIAGGCFLLIRTHLFKKLKGFDDHFFVYFEDYDFSLRVLEFTKIAYVPDIKITHMGGFVGGKSFRHHWYFSISAIKFFFRHGWKLW